MTGPTQGAAPSSGTAALISPLGDLPAPRRYRPLRRAVGTGCAGLVIWVTPALASLPVSVTGVSVGPPVAIAAARVNMATATTSFMQLPFAASFPGPAPGPRVVMLSYSAQLDSRWRTPKVATERSTDGGRTFTPQASGVPASTMGQLADGSLLSVAYTTAARPQAPGAGSTVLTTTFWRSHDLGATWVAQHGTITAAGRNNRLYFNRGMVRADDGSLLAPTYGWRAGDPRSRVMLARSTDQGASWQIVSTIATAPLAGRYHERTEPTIARAAGGDLVVVMRQYAPVNPAVCAGAYQGAPLLIARSSNDGATWTRAVPLSGPGLATATVSSADPDLTTMAGGQLILSFGRPGDGVLVSADGSGRTWGNLTLTSHGPTSGYTAIVALGGNTALQVGDFGSNWCFYARARAVKVGVWSRVITLHLTHPPAHLLTQRRAQT